MFSEFFGMLLFVTNEYLLVVVNNEALYINCPH